MTRRLNATDNLFLQLETETTPMHVGGLLMFSGEVANRYEGFRNSEVRSEPFNWRLQLSRLPGLRPSWQPLDRVDLSRHVHHHSLAGSGGQEQLMALVSELHSRPVDRNHPMWECHVLAGLEGGRFGIYYKVHHACIDGMAGIKHMQEGLSQCAGGPTLPLWSREQPLRRRGRHRGLGERMVRSATRLRNNISSAGEIIAALRELRQVNGSATPRAVMPYTAPDSPLNSVLSTGRRALAWTEIPLADVRAISKAVNGTVNDVALAICSTVLRNYLLSINGLPDRPLVAMVPMALRDVGGREATGNQVSYILCNLATDLSDPVERLRAIIASSCDGKRMLRQMSNEAAAAWALVVGFPAIMAQLVGLVENITLPFNVVISNVPGPRSPLYENGAQLEAIYASSLLFERQNLNVTLLSYLDRIGFGLTACPGAISNLPDLARDIGSAFEELKRALL